MQRTKVFRQIYLKHLQATIPKKHLYSRPTPHWHKKGDKLLKEEQLSVSNCYKGMDFEKVLQEKVPLHARFYSWYVPENGRNYEKCPKEDLQEEIDDISEDGDTQDSKSEYENGKALVPEIRRAIKSDDEENEFEEEFEAIEYFNGEVVDHEMYNIFTGVAENEIRKFNWGIKNFKIFHIWNISLNNKKTTFLPWSAKFQSDENKIELEISSYNKTENGTSQTKVVDFGLDAQACDVPLFAIVDDCKIKYSLLSNAIRVKFEIRTYNDDGSPVLDVNGHIRAYFDFRGHYEKYIFGGHIKWERQEWIAENTLMLSPSSLIIPRDLGCVYLDMSLKDKDGKFMVEGCELVWRRTVAVDEQHYIVGKKGHIILTTIWSCLCVDSKHGICTCPGTAMGTFQAEENDTFEDTKDESDNHTYCPTIACDDNSIEYGMKRANIRQTRQICSTTEEATTGDEDGK